MTPEELKFALLVENVLNNIPQPEYRQLIVETLIVLTLLADAPKVRFLSDNLNVDAIVLKANNMFFEDEVSFRVLLTLMVSTYSTLILVMLFTCIVVGSRQR